MEQTTIDTQSTALKHNTKNLVLTGLMAALICILGPFSIPLPVSPVPLSLTTLAIYFAVYVLGLKRGTLSCIIYVLLGLVGLPVFSGFSGGPGKLFGPTGGYIIGYIFMVLICGLFIDKWPGKWYLCLCGMLLGTAVCYVFGSAWLAFQNSLSLPAALMLGAVPFIPGDLLKIGLALILGIALRKALLHAHLLA